MRFNCLHCQAILEIPSELNIENQVTPLKLKCPRCQGITIIKLSNLHFQNPEIIKITLKKILTVYHLIKSSFISSSLSEESKEKSSSYLRNKIISYFTNHPFGVFNFLISAALIFLLLGLAELSKEFHSSGNYQTLAWLIGIIISTLLIFFYKYLDIKFLNSLLETREGYLTENILHISFMIFLSFYLQIWAVEISTYKQFQFTVSKSISIANLYSMIAYFSWLFILYFSVFITKRRIYLYVLIFSLFTNIFIELPFRFSLLHTSSPLAMLFQLVNPAIYHALGIIIFLFILGPGLSYLILRSIAVFAPKLYTSTFEKRVLIFIYAESFLIPLYYIVISKQWEVISFLILYFFIFLLFLIRSIFSIRRIIFYSSLYFGFLLQYLFIRSNYYIADYVMLIFFIVFQMLLFAPNIVFRIHFLKGEWSKENDLLPRSNYLYSNDYAIQAVLSLFSAILGHFLLFKSDFYYLYSILIFFIAIAILYINFYRTSRMAIFLAWIQLFLAVSGIISKSHFNSYGVSWFIIFILLGIIAFVWKIFLHPKYSSNIEKQFHDEVKDDIGIDTKQEQIPSKILSRDI